MNKQQIANQLFDDWMVSVIKLGIDRDYMESRLTQHFKKRAKAAHVKSAIECEKRWALYEAVCKIIDVWPDEQSIYKSIPASEKGAAA